MSKRKIIRTIDMLAECGRCEINTLIQLQAQRGIVYWAARRGASAHSFAAGFLAEQLGIASFVWAVGKRKEARL